MVSGEIRFRVKIVVGLMLVVLCASGDLCGSGSERSENVTENPPPGATTVNLYVEIDYHERTRDFMNPATTTYDITTDVAAWDAEVLMGDHSFENDCDWAYHNEDPSTHDPRDFNVVNSGGSAVNWTSRTLMGAVKEVGYEPQILDIGPMWD
jgi:hypothetical protein